MKEGLENIFLNLYTFEFNGKKNCKKLRKFSICTTVSLQISKHQLPQIDSVFDHNTEDIVEKRRFSFYLQKFSS